MSLAAGRAGVETTERRFEPTAPVLERSSTADSRPSPRAAAGNQADAINPVVAGALAAMLISPGILPDPRPEPVLPLRAEVPVSSTPAAPSPRAVWPLDPRPEVVTGFEPPDGPYSAGHRGVDLLGAPGQPVLTALGGTVAFAGTLAGRGVVVVDHGAFRTTYEPVRPRVRRGDSIATGESIGSLETGLSHCPPRSCLHWGLIEGDGYRDPLSLVEAGRVRLLPFDPPDRHARG